MFKDRPQAAGAPAPGYARCGYDRLSLMALTAFSKPGAHP